MPNDKPVTIDEQIDMMKKYVSFTKKARMRNFLQYSGYFRASRYGKYLLSFTNVFAKKPSQNELFALYQFDFELRKIMYEACAKAEIQIKAAISNAVSLKTDDAYFYLDSHSYTPTRGERNKFYRQKNAKTFNRFYTSLQEQEKKMRSDTLKYPALKEYRNGGAKAASHIPCWAAFSYFELGTVENIYMYLRSDLKKEILVYGYSRDKYGKKITLQADTWLNGVRTLRNICAHHAMLVGMRETIVLAEAEDDADILPNGEDLFSRLYALKKLMNAADSETMKNKLKKAIGRAKIDVYQLEILPQDWEDKFDRIKYL